MKNESSCLVKNSMPLRLPRRVLFLDVHYLGHRSAPKFLVYISGKLFCVQDIFNLSYSVMPRDINLVTFFFSYLHHWLAKFGLVGTFQSETKRVSLN